MISPRPEIPTLPGYNPGRSVALAKQETGATTLIKLASNESLWGPSPQVLTALSQNLSRIAQYPEVVPQALLARLHEVHRLPVDSLIVGNGADELLRVIAQVYINPGDEVIYPEPSFSSYAYATALMGGHGVPVALTPEGHMDSDGMLRHITPQTRIIYLCSPNNPTGGVMSQKAWDYLLDQVPDRVLVVLDEAYHEYVDNPEAAHAAAAARSSRPILMVRTFSKIFGLAGLRVGWAAGPREIIKNLQKAREPFATNLLAQIAAEAALGDLTYIEKVRKETLKGRLFLYHALTRRGYQPLPSQTNFLTFPIEDAEHVADRLEPRGFIVRPTKGFGLPGHLRVTVAPEPILVSFLEAFDEVRSSDDKRRPL